MFGMQVLTLKKWGRYIRVKLFIIKKVSLLKVYPFHYANLYVIDDIHIATLTVAQTLSFALSTKTPGPKARLPGVSRKDFSREVQTTLLKMLNIQHTANTLVGNEFVRGVSGGERKRVSIAEMMATRAHVQCWDKSLETLEVDLWL